MVNFLYFQITHYCAYIQLADCKIYIFYSHPICNSTGMKLATQGQIAIAEKLDCIPSSVVKERSTLTLPERS